jgi:hypothetical protein
MTLLLERTPQIVRKRIDEAQDGLRELCEYCCKFHDHLDLLHVQLLCSKITVALEAAKHELTDATCDAEAALARF